MVYCFLSKLASPMNNRSNSCKNICVQLSVNCSTSGYSETDMVCIALMGA